MLVETCDITIEKNSFIYFKYIQIGKVSVSFLGNKHLTDDTAECIKILCEIFFVKKKEMLRKKVNGTVVTDVEME